MRKGGGGGGGGGEEDCDKTYLCLGMLLPLTSLTFLHLHYLINFEVLIAPGETIFFSGGKKIIMHQLSI